ncbi:hypothetical protein CL615_04605 [archaeon]|jgi:hypothetical protein|nr:hypothetical protein [archaeon]MDP6548077.1 hypothetical protein [Candidatus Woesearchaeota archaeon]|tara:strand:+ start:1014 stop:1490 length:477 start_codon:yes stop_codon:yes gene_type:complete
MTSKTYDDGLGKFLEEMMNKKIPSIEVWSNELSEELPKYFKGYKDLEKTCELIAGVQKKYEKLEDPEKANRAIKIHEISNGLYLSPEYCDKNGKKYAERLNAASGDAMLNEVDEGDFIGNKQVLFKETFGLGGLFDKIHKNLPIKGFRPSDYPSCQKK